jgi:hypothetical protein
LTCGKHLYDCNISLREEVWTHKTGLTPPLVIEVYEGSRDIERSCICVFGVLLLVLWLDCSDGVLFFIIFVTMNAWLIPSLGFSYTLNLSTETIGPKLIRLVRIVPLYIISDLKGVIRSSFETCIHLYLRLYYTLSSFTENRNCWPLTL